MAWLAVDKSGEEYIFVENKPERMENHSTNDYEWFPKYKSDKWAELPQGTIEELIGRDLTWHDEPVEI